MRETQRKFCSHDLIVKGMTLLIQLISVGIVIRAVDSTLLCSMSGTELRGNATICPGNSGIFECKTTNTDILVWRVNGTTISIPEDHRVANGPVIVSENIASLVELNLTNGNIGDRTSLLRVPPNNGIVSVECIGGNTMNTCSRDINFVGTGGIQQPVNCSLIKSDDGNNVTYSWEHDSEDTVSYYDLTFGAVKDGSTIFRFNVTSIRTSITNPATNNDLNGMLSAISVCGDESEPVPLPFQAGTTGLKPAVPAIASCLVILFYGVLN